MTDDAVSMVGQAVGRIVDFPKGNPPRLYDCPSCPVYRRTIENLKLQLDLHKARIDALEKDVKEYLDGYAERKMHQEGEALMKLRSVLGE